MKVAGADKLGILNHWYYFTDEKNVQLYSAILRRRDAWDIAVLRMINVLEREGAECVAE
ncbi:MAG: hypothetical protein J0I06_13060 [Planctomycetes bacterium]|nr:hypothetical protein [Planctomycetota bacterium]